MFALASGHERSQNLQPRSLRIFHNAIDHLLHGLRRDFDAVVRTMRLADPRKQQAQIIVNFRYRTDRGARIAACRLLVDGDRRG